MTTLYIPRLNPGTEDRIRVRAARNGRSLEAEARTILTEAVATDPEPEPATPEQPTGKSFYEEIRSIVEPVEGFDLERLPKEPPRAPDFSGPEW